jgi:serine/threonine-protein kinase RsbW
MTRHELVVAATMDDLPLMLDFVERCCSDHALDAATCLTLRLAVEEVCMNVIVHGYAGSAPGLIRIGFNADPVQAVITVEDDAPPFDPASAPPPDLTSDWENRQLGGLGWHLVRAMVDELRHDRLGTAGNRTTLLKRLPSAPFSQHEDNSHGNPG